MGASYSLHTAYRTHQQLAGCFAIAPFLFNDSLVYEALKVHQSPAAGTLPKLLVMHGGNDKLLHHEWGLYAFRKLTMLGVTGEFHTLHGVQHEVRRSQLLYIEQWARNLLRPSADTSLIHHKL